MVLLVAFVDLACFGVSVSEEVLFVGFVGLKKNSGRCAVRFWNVIIAFCDASIFAAVGPVLFCISLLCVCVCLCK